MALVGLRVGAELLEIVDRQVLARDKHDWDLGDERDRGEICRRIVQGLLIETLALGMGTDRTQHERVAVGRRIGDPLRPGHAAGAAHVLDHYLLAHDLAHALRNDAAQHIGRAARRERNDHAQRLAGIILGRRRPAEGEQDAKNSGGQSRKHILSSLELAQKAQLSGPAQTINPPPPSSVLCSS